LIIKIFSMSFSFCNGHKFTLYPPPAIAAIPNQ
jgi:hypothetical protein